MALDKQMTKTIVDISTNGAMGLVTRLTQSTKKEIMPIGNFSFSGIEVCVLAAIIPKTKDVPHPKKFCLIQTMVSLSVKYKAK